MPKDETAKKKPDTPNTEGRFLTESEKKDLLEKLRAQYQSAKPDGGPDCMDANLIPILEQLNAIPGLCVIQFSRPNADQPSRNLRFRLSRGASAAFRGEVAAVLAVESVNLISTLYEKGDNPARVREVVSIYLANLDRLDVLIPMLRAIVTGSEDAQ